MRYALWLMIVLAAIGSAQWRHFGEEPRSSPVHDMLAEHNAMRANVGVAPLAWSDHLAAISQAWADSLLAHGKFVHSPNSSYGENLFEVVGAAASSARVVAVWAGESRQYEYSSNKCRGVCGLHANRLERYEGSWMRGSARQGTRGLGVRVRSARQLGR